jgi:hypothetical protein
MSFIFTSLSLCISSSPPPPPPKAFSHTYIHIESCAYI